MNFIYCIVTDLQLNNFPELEVIQDNFKFEKNCYANFNKRSIDIDSFDLTQFKL